jgi:hypothetical protein
MESPFLTIQGKAPSGQETAVGGRRRLGRRRCRRGRDTEHGSDPQVQGVDAGVEVQNALDADAVGL